MKVTKPMIQRGVVAYHSSRAVDSGTLVEDILRAACNDPAKPVNGQTRLDVVDGETVMVVDG
jgi:hypothetical protein